MSQINVNTITGKDGGSAVNFPHGITVTGVVTATTPKPKCSWCCNCYYF